jgi:hypothetical protein
MKHLYVPSDAGLICRAKRSAAGNKDSPAGVGRGRAAMREGGLSSVKAPPFRAPLLMLPRSGGKRRYGDSSSPEAIRGSVAPSGSRKYCDFG